LPFVKELSDKYIRGRTKEKFEDGRKEGFRKIFYDKTLKIVNGQMGTSVPYAYLHEYGIGKHPARPFLDPAVKDTKPKMANIIEGKLSEAYKKTNWK